MSDVELRPSLLAHQLRALIDGQEAVSAAGYAWACFDGFQMGSVHARRATVPDAAVQLNHHESPSVGARCMYGAGWRVPSLAILS